MESLETFEENFGGDNAGCDGCSINQREAQKSKSHLLQSQIRLIEAEIESLNQSFEKNAHLSVWAIGYNRALCDQISSLNETLEELKKSL